MVRELLLHTGLITKVNPSKLFLDQLLFQKSQGGCRTSQPRSGFCSRGQPGGLTCLNVEYEQNCSQQLMRDTSNGYRQKLKTDKGRKILGKNHNVSDKALLQCHTDGLRTPETFVIFHKMALTLPCQF